MGTQASQANNQAEDIPMASTMVDVDVQDTTSEPATLGGDCDTATASSLKHCASVAALRDNKNETHSSADMSLPVIPLTLTLLLKSEDTRSTTESVAAAIVAIKAGTTTFYENDGASYSYQQGCLPLVSRSSFVTNRGLTILSDDNIHQ
ncbi:hypothetical protein K438DRAFT_1757509 [Mycena galopus ATCC 62051]|nr:hypothetical protein K438DRAFT_1757509 [Mycena galopus ATCC 62051]